MSDTAVCEDAHLKRKVVVKGLKAGIEKHRLMDELSALSAIRSKHVVQVLDVIYDGADIVGLVEEFIDGPDLTPLMANCDQNTVLKALYPIATGVADVHAHGRLHRDLKPENMKFDGSGVLKLFDFGLAKLATQASTAKLYFSHGYAPPEIFTKDSAGNFNFTAAVDVFALGATAWWMLNAGTLPNGLQQVPPALPCADFSALGRPLSPDLAQMLNSTLDAAPANRPTAAALMGAIARQLLFQRHTMLFTHGGVAHLLSAANPSVTLSEGTDSVSITYDGYDFRVVAVAGYVRRNNVPMAVGDLLTGASVIVLGDPADSRSRTSITADVSHPQVTL